MCKESDFKVEYFVTPKMENWTLSKFKKGEWVVVEHCQFPERGGNVPPFMKETMLRCQAWADIQRLQPTHYTLLIPSINNKGVCGK